MSEIAFRDTNPALSIASFLTHQGAAIFDVQHVEGTQCTRFPPETHTEAQREVEALGAVAPSRCRDYSVCCDMAALRETILLSKRHPHFALVWSFLVAAGFTALTAVPQSYPEPGPS